MKLEAALRVTAAALLCIASASAQDAFVQEQSSGAIKITACVVASVRDKSIHQDCTNVAAKTCDGAMRCELPIGLNLTGGRDIDPVGVRMVRRLGKVVDVEFSCGKGPQKRGPNYQNNNATLVLAC